MPCPPRPEKPTNAIIEHTKKGCIFWFDPNNSDPSISSQCARPYIILNTYNPKSTRVIISPISDRNNYVEKGTEKTKYPYHAPIYKKDNVFLDMDSVVLLDQMYTIPKDELIEEWFMGKLSDNLELDQSLMYNFDMYSSIYEIYQQLFNELSGKVKVEHMENFTRK